MTRLTAIPALLSSFALLAFTQQQAPVNLNFRASEPGQTPAGWVMPAAAQGFPVVVTELCAKSGNRCAVMRSEKAAARAQFGNLMQYLDASEYRGRGVT
jgi:hypothetical protein